MMMTYVGVECNYISTISRNFVLLKNVYHFPTKYNIKYSIRDFVYYWLDEETKDWSLCAYYVDLGTALDVGLNFQRDSDLVHFRLRWGNHKNEELIDVMAI